MEERRFLFLKYKSSSKKIALTNDRLALKFIEDGIALKFSVVNPDLQYWDTDVDEWLDLDEESLGDIQDKSVVKVQVVCKEPRTPLRNKEQEKQDVQPVEIQPHAASQPTQLKECKTIQNPGNKEHACSFAGKSEVDSNLFKRKPWPRIYEFPVATCPRSFLMKLETHQDLAKRDISQLLDTMYNDVTLYEGGLYPTSEKYGTLVDAILARFPYLANQGDDMPLQSVRVYWKEKLKHKWGNERKLRDREMPEVKSRKRKTAMENSESPTKRMNLTWGLSNYLPPPLPSEDDASVKLHIEWLQREWKKTEPNIRSVDLKMDLTFPERRVDIITKGLSVSDLLEKYPWLQRRDQLLSEFSRLGPSTTISNMDTLMLDGLSKYHEAITRLAKGKRMPKFQEVIYEEMHLQRVDTQRKYSSICASVLGLGTLLKEKLDKLVKVGDQPEGQTGIQLITKEKITTTYKDAFEVHIEDMCLFSCDTFMEAVAGLMAAIYSFNLAYPKEFEKTFIFIQNVVLGLSDEKKADKRILSVIAELNKERKLKN